MFFPPSPRPPSGTILSTSLISPESTGAHRRRSRASDAPRDTVSRGPAGSGRGSGARGERAREDRVALLDARACPHRGEERSGLAERSLDGGVAERDEAAALPCQGIGLLEHSPETLPARGGVSVALGRLGIVALGLREQRPGRGERVLEAATRYEASPGRCLRSEPLRPRDRLVELPGVDQPSRSSADARRASERAREGRAPPRARSAGGGRNSRPGGAPRTMWHPAGDAALRRGRLQQPEPREAVADRGRLPLVRLDAGG